MEDLVYQAMEEARSRYQFCNCLQCEADIAAIALNQLPPRYVVDRNIQRTDLLDSSDYQQAFKVVVSAAKKVKKRPHHQ